MPGQLVVLDDLQGLAFQCDPRATAVVLNDALRIRRRSALTAFVLALPEMLRAHVADANRLFEYLLIDVEMDPCMKTSRIGQGISSVQLFIQRVLLNLESPEVPPTRVDSGQWKWRKNYRVWEANRKVFLYPESCLEEELRDDKTPIFKELESELLQDELTDANAERAFRHYLEKLDGVAKLIVCGTFATELNAQVEVVAKTIDGKAKIAAGWARCTHSCDSRYCIYIIHIFSAPEDRQHHDSCRPWPLHQRERHGHAAQQQGSRVAAGQGHIQRR